MSVFVNAKNISIENRKRFDRELVCLQETNGGKTTKKIYPFNIFKKNADTFVSLPYSYALNSGFKPRKTSEYRKCNYSFNGTLRPEQVPVVEEAFDILNKCGSLILALPPGFGKTSMSIYIAHKTKLPVLVTISRVILLEQWLNAYTKFCADVSAVILTSKNGYGSDLHSLYDIYLVNPLNIQKIPPSILESIGVFIVDECHMIATECYSIALREVAPRYLIGLSATPYRSDGMNSMLDFYFGKRKISRSIVRKHTVIAVSTNFVPEVRKGYNGKVDWNYILEQQSLDNERNNCIAQIIKILNKRTFLVICKRVEQIKIIQDKLLALGIKSTTLCGTNNTYDKTCRVLIATVQKAGVGFDDERINAMVIASDVQEYFVQYLGRCMRVKDNHPIVIDFVDRNNILGKHFDSRVEVYRSAGGTIINCSVNNLDSIVDPMYK